MRFCRLGPAVGGAEIQPPLHLPSQEPWPQVLSLQGRGVCFHFTQRLCVDQRQPWGSPALPVLMGVLSSRCPSGLLSSFLWAYTSCSQEFCGSWASLCFVLKLIFFCKRVWHYFTKKVSLWWYICPTSGPLNTLFSQTTANSLLWLNPSCVSSTGLNINSSDGLPTHTYPHGSHLTHTILCHLMLFSVIVM